MFKDVIKSAALFLTMSVISSTAASADGNLLISTECENPGRYPSISIKVQNNSPHTYDKFVIYMEVFDKGGNFLDEKKYYLDNIRPRRHGIEALPLIQAKGVLCSEIGSLEFFLAKNFKVNGIRMYGGLEPDTQLAKEIESMLTYQSTDPANYTVKSSSIPHGS